MHGVRQANGERSQSGAKMSTISCEAAALGFAQHSNFAAWDDLASLHTKQCSELRQVFQDHVPESLHLDREAPLIGAGVATRHIKRSGCPSTCRGGIGLAVGVVIGLVAADFPAPWRCER